MSKKSKHKFHTKSEQSLAQPKSENRFREMGPLDTLCVHIKNLRIYDESYRHFTVKVMFYNQLIVTGVVQAVGAREDEITESQVEGEMQYEPGDYEKMCQFANFPLVVTIKPYLQGDMHGLGDRPSMSKSLTAYSVQQIAQSQAQLQGVSMSNVNMKPILTDVSGCNVDVLPMFLELDKMCVVKRMEPLVKPLIIQQSSWDTLPLITMELFARRNPDNIVHHDVLKSADYMKLTLVGIFNMLLPFSEDIGIAAYSKTPLANETEWGSVVYVKPERKNKSFNPERFYPSWESIRMREDLFAKGDKKLEYTLYDIHNKTGMDLEQYMNFSNDISQEHSAIFGSFHRTLMLKNSGKWLEKHVKKWNWPLEIHMHNENDSPMSFVVLLDIFKLLYPGTTKVRIAAPLQWLTPQWSSLMKEKCNCDLFIPFVEKVADKQDKKQETKGLEVGPSSGTSTETATIMRATGREDTNAFVVVEVLLSRPLFKPKIPPFISNADLDEMLANMESHGYAKRDCTGRGQLNRDWKTTIRLAANSLRRVPNYGMTDFCTFYRQLSETRTRVELTTSFWMEAAIYINNNFVLQDYLKSEEMFQELVLMSHTCLMQKANHILLGIERFPELDPKLRAARHSRQLQDVPHAVDLYLLVLSENPREPNHWRELSTCLKAVDRQCAKICLDKSLELNIRHPLTLLSKACMVFEESPDDAEPFFMAIISLFPFWSTAWIVTSAYFRERELYRVAEQVIECWRQNKANRLIQELNEPRSWEHELGDWWDPALLLPGMSQLYDAADLLLRLRGLHLAESCIALALSESGETAVYYHLVALCCRLQDKIDDALCHLKKASAKFENISYLLALEAECHHRNKDFAAASAAFEKAGLGVNCFSSLLSLPTREPNRVRSMLIDLIRRQPNAYVWMAMADDWMSRVTPNAPEGNVIEDQSNALACATACAVQALRIDRRAGRAWAHLAKHVRPHARRQLCRNMAILCGYDFGDEPERPSSRHSICYRVGKALRECFCEMCNHIAIS